MLQLAVLLLTLTLAQPCWSSDQPKASLPSAAEIQRLGEQLYRHGLLPSGAPLQALIRGDVTVDGRAFSCESCHQRSGIGSVEGQILSPPTNGNKLYKPYYQYNPLPPDEQKPRKSMMDNPSAKPLHRSAYDDASLARAIVDGINPDGRALNAVMPRYQIDDADMAILIAYLKTLSAEPSPGVSAQEIRFATVVAGDVPAADRQEMLAALQAILGEHNRKARIKDRYLNYGTVMKAAPFNYPKFTLDVWELKGARSTWRQQLEQQYHQKPVFALLGGLSSADWQPMHTFSEQNKVPCLLPITDLPTIGATGWYTLYFNKGSYQEGEAAARHLQQSPDFAADSPVVQIIEDTDRARAVAAGFQAVWNELGYRAPVNLTIRANEKVSAERLRELTEPTRPAAIMIWTGPESMPAAEGGAAANTEQVRRYVSATLLKDAVLKLPEQLRSVTYITYPYRVGQGQGPFQVNARVWLQKKGVPTGTGRIATRLYSLAKVLLEPFQVVKRDFNPSGRGNGLVIMEEQSEMMLHVKRNYYRDYLLDVIGMMADTDSLDYERISFGPGQRYLSKGCYIVQLSPDPQPQLIKKSDWVIY